jgi:uncharacterized protein YdhG (YjbR/CyaY superfamily)
MANKGPNRTTSADVDRYIENVADPAMKQALIRLRGEIRAVVPDGVEKISYQIPMFYYLDRGLVSFAAFKAHCTLFVQSKAVTARLGRRGGLTGSPSSIHFTPDKPIPASVVKAIVRARMREVEEQRKKKVSGYSTKKKATARK